MNIVLTEDNELLVPSFSVVDTSNQVATSVVFTDGSTDNGLIVSYSRDFGDGNISSGQNPSHSYETVGKYTVELTVIDDGRKSNTLSDDIYIWGEKWSFTTGGSIRSSSPSIADDGTIYVGSDDDNVYALNPDGTQKWKVGLGDGGNSRSGVAIHDGVVYVTTREATGHIKALNIANGNEIWASAAIAGDGTVYFASRDNKIYAIEVFATGLNT